MSSDYPSLSRGVNLAEIGDGEGATSSTVENPTATQGTSLRAKRSTTLAYKCEQEGCGYAAKTTEDLTTHLRIHAVFVCKLEGCNFATTTRSQLKKHTKAEHLVRSDASGGGGGGGGGGEGGGGGGAGGGAGAMVATEIPHVKANKRFRASCALVVDPTILSDTKDTSTSYVTLLIDGNGQTKVLRRWRQLPNMQELL
jgi:hypothetical protein